MNAEAILLKQNIQRLQASNATLQRQIAMLEAALATQRNEAQVLRAANAAQATRLAEVEFDKLRADLREVELVLDRTCLERDEIGENYNLVARENHELQDGCRALATDNTELRAQLAGAAFDRLCAAGELATAQRAIAQLQAERDTLQELCTTQGVNLDRFSRENYRLTGIIADLRTEKAELWKRYDQLETDLQFEANMHGMAETSITRLLAENAALREDPVAALGGLVNAADLKF